MTMHRAGVALCGLIAALGCGLGHSQALAHGVYIFAWVDNNTICSESYFAKNTKVQGGTVSVRGTDGSLLAEGLTDGQGLWCFPTPTPQALTLTVNAGQGHRAEFVLPAKAFAGSEADTSPPVAASSLASTENARGEADSGKPDGDALAKLVREAVRAELHAQLAPIRQALAEHREDQTPSARDIFGGLGWIVGLAGLAAWYTSRRKP